MKQATMCFLAGFLHHHVGSCMRDDSRPWFSMVNESDQSNEGVVVVANELRSIGAIGSTQQEFENAFNEQVNEVYSQQFGTKTLLSFLTASKTHLTAFWTQVVALVATPPSPKIFVLLSGCRCFQSRKARWEMVTSAMSIP